MPLLPRASKPPLRWASLALLIGLLGVGCRSGGASTLAGPDATTAPTSSTLSPPRSQPTIASEATSSSSSLTVPDWLGQRPLVTNEDGFGVAVPTPPELTERRLPTRNALSPPADDSFAATIEPFGGEPLERSTWHEGCPVAPADLRYLTMTFWGFDDRHHRGEMVVAADVADDIVTVFAALHEARFPIEEMRIVTPDELTTPPTGDDNNTTAFVCRSVTGGTSFSQHAYGLAIDLNPFHNPYEREELVLPELAGAYLDRSYFRPGMILDDDVVVAAFESVGWHWGGRWETLKDYQHFSLNNR